MFKIFVYTMWAALVLTAIQCGFDVNQKQEVSGEAEVKAVFEDSGVLKCLDFFEKKILTFPQLERCLELTSSKTLAVEVDGSIEGIDLPEEIKEALKAKQEGL